MPKPLTVWITIKLWKILKEMGIPDHLTCFLKNLYAGQEATVRTGHGTTDWFQIGKGVRQGSLSPCLFNLYTEYIMRKTGLDEAQAGIKIAGRNINNPLPGPGPSPSTQHCGDWPCRAAIINQGRLCPAGHMWWSLGTLRLSRLGTGRSCVCHGHRVERSQRCC